MAQLKAMIQRTVGVRREGSAALDLAYVACGRTDGYWEMNLNPWDIAAGALLQVVLKVAPDPGPTWMKPRPPFRCACCGAPMRIVQRRIPAPERWRSATPTGSVTL